MNVGLYLCSEWCNFFGHFKPIFVNFIRRRAPLPVDRFQTEAALTCDLIALIFDLSTYKWRQESPLFTLSLPIFSLPRRSILDLALGTGQTDRRTDDGHQRLMLHTMEAGA